MEKIRVYVTSPYTKGDVDNNGKTQLDCADELINHDFIPFTAQTRMAHPRPYEDWVKTDLQWVEECHVVLRFPGESTVADREVKHARELGVPIVYSLEDLLEMFPQNKISKKKELSHPLELLVGKEIKDIYSNTRQNKLIFITSDNDAIVFKVPSKEDAWFGNDESILNLTGSKVTKVVAHQWKDVAQKAGEDMPRIDIVSAKGTAKLTLHYGGENFADANIRTFHYQNLTADNIKSILQEMEAVSLVKLGNTNKAIKTRKPI